MRVQAEFRYEGIPFDETAFRDNTDVIELLDGGKTSSVLGLLNSAAVSASQPDDARFVQELHNHYGDGKHAAYAVPRLTATTQFTIRHFAAHVTYTADGGASMEGFVSRNKDALLPKLPALLRTSKSPFLASLFPAIEATTKGVSRYRCNYRL